MISRFTLESFEAPEAKPTQLEIDPAEFEDARLAAFEKGYTAGWDDAAAAQDAEMTRLRADLGQNLKALAFTYHEAHQNVLDALRPLLVDITAKVLPSVARQALAPIVAEQLMPVAEKLAGQPVTVVASPVSLPQIRELLSDEKSLPLIFTAEPSLGDCQVYLRFADKETHVDLDGVIALISDAITTYFRVKQEDPEHG
ncbi:MAG: flagellar biosynthesis protein [Paracoccaceae bacterium]|nr:flagellar biosynthesis protein [Paracoccaceae bacterium]